MFSVPASLRLLKIGDANGAELALLGGPAVLFQPLLPFSGGVLLGAHNSTMLVHEYFVFGETGSAVSFVSGAVKHLGAGTAQHLILLAVNVIKAVGRTRVISSH